MTYLKAILSFLTSVITSLTLLMCPTPGDTQTAKLIDERCYSLVDAFVMGQGLDFASGTYYTSGALSAFKLTALAKIDAATGEVTSVVLDALPQSFKNDGYDHIGDISVEDGIIYAPVEDKAETMPLVLLYSADTLEYTGKYYNLDAELLTDGVPWVATDENYLYASQFNRADEIFVYNRSDMTLSHTLKLSQAVYRVQSGDCFGGVLYLSSDPKEGDKLVYSVDLQSGETKIVFTRKTSGFDTEAEGMCVIESGGDTLFVVADYNKLASTFLRTYKAVD